MRTWVKKIGALTSKPYSFKSRSWELKYLESLDLYDSLNSNIKIHYKNSQILRILPNINENINEEWITDKIRFSYDSINRWRFISPLIQQDSQFIQISWNKAFFFIQQFQKENSNHFTRFIGGNYTSLESLYSLKLLQQKITNSSIELHEYKNQTKVDFFSSNLINFSSKTNQVYLFVGTNLRLENPILNLKFRKLSKKKNIFIGFIGSSYNTTIYMQHIGNNTDHLLKILQGKHKFNFLIKKFFTNNLWNKPNITCILGFRLSNKIWFRVYKKYFI